MNVYAPAGHMTHLGLHSYHFGNSLKLRVDVLQVPFEGLAVQLFSQCLPLWHTAKEQTPIRRGIQVILPSKHGRVEVLTYPHLQPLATCSLYPKKTKCSRWESKQLRGHHKAGMEHPNNTTSCSDITTPNIPNPETPAAWPWGSGRSSQVCTGIYMSSYARTMTSNTQGVPDGHPEDNLNL